MNAEDQRHSKIIHNYSFIFQMHLFCLDIQVNALNLAFPR